MKSMLKYILIAAVVLVGITFAYLFLRAGSNFGPGLADYESKINESCTLDRSSAHQVTVRCEGMPEVEPKVISLGWNNDFLIAMTHPVTKKAYPDNPNNSYMVPDESITYWWIRDLKNKKAYGPMSQAEFDQKKIELQIPNIQLMSEDEARSQGTEVTGQ